MPNDFDKKFNKLPKAVQKVLVSNYGRELENNIYKKYELKDFPFRLIGETVSSLCFEDLLLKDLVLYLEKTFNLTEEKTRDMAIDLVGMRILILRKYLKKENVGQWMMSMGADVKDYTQYIIKTNEDIRRSDMGEKTWWDLKDEEDRKKREEKEGLQTKEIKKVGPEEEKRNAVNVFSDSGIKHLLKSKKNPNIRFFNETLMSLLDEDDKFGNELERAFLNNETKLTYKKFVLEGKNKRPTIANWLKDFITRFGSGMFNNVVLLNYINKSDNVKLLDNDERDLVKKLVLLYRNLKFFPDNFRDLPEEQWQIVPEPAQEEEFKKTRKIKTKKTLEEAPKQRDKEKEDLENMIRKYKPGSFERKALEEEMKK